MRFPDRARQVAKPITMQGLEPGIGRFGSGDTETAYDIRRTIDSDWPKIVERKQAAEHGARAGADHHVAALGFPRQRRRQIGRCTLDRLPARPAVRHDQTCEKADACVRGLPSGRGSGAVAPVFERAIDSALCIRLVRRRQAEKRGHVPGATPKAAAPPWRATAPSPAASQQPDDGSRILGTDDEWVIPRMRSGMAQRTVTWRLLRYLSAPKPRATGASTQTRRPLGASTLKRPQKLDFCRDTQLSIDRAEMRSNGSRRNEEASAISR